MIKRKPDLVIGEKYLHRWFIIPRNKYFNIYLHKFMDSDEDRALHDHPWWSVSFLLKGELKEHMLPKIRLIPRFLPIFRSAKHAHRLELINGPAWTIFITGPRIRTWGFHCSKGWRKWQDFVDDNDSGKVGKGCEGLE